MATKGDGKDTGLKTGLGVTAAWTALLRKNRIERLQDAALVTLMKADFPRRKKFQPIARVRSFFNRGIQGFGYGENIRGTGKESFAYDGKGKVTANSQWGRDRKKNPKLSKLAKKRALAQWAAAKAPKKKMKVMKAKPATAKKKAKVKSTPAVKSKVKLKVSKKKPAAAPNNVGATAA